MKTKFLVCREGLLRPHNSIRTSDHFPMVIEVDTTEWTHFGEEEFYEWVLNKALDTINEGYRSPWRYVIVPMSAAVLISHKPVVVVPKFETVIEPYNLRR